MHIAKIAAIILGILWGTALLGFIILFYPFSRHKAAIEWRKICRWEEND